MQGAGTPVGTSARRRLAVVGLLALGLALLLAPALPTRAQEATDDRLVIDLSEKFVPITTGFSGSRLLLYGMTDGDSDVVVAIRGFRQIVTVHKKGRFAGIWVNREQVRFERVPAFYSLAASGPLDIILKPEVQKRYQLGLKHLRLALAEGQHDVKDAESFRDALVRAKVRRNLYQPAPRSVSLIGNQLFRTELVFPVNVPIGVYIADAYLVKDGTVVEQRSTFLEVRKFGMEAEIYKFAHQNSLAYGVFATLIAVLAGWLAAIVYRKG